MRNSWLTSVMSGLAVFQLFVLPLWLVPADPNWGWALLTLPAMTTPFWSLIHEAIHGSLHKDRARNDRVGRLLSIGYGAPFVMLKTGHLLHHRYSRTQRERAESYDPAESTWSKAAAEYYFRLLGGLYVLEVVSMLFALLPIRAMRRFARWAEEPDSVGGLLLDRLASDRNRRQFRIDSAAVVVVYTLAFVAYGSHGWLLLAAIAGRALVVSVSDNAYHYDTRLDAPREAMNLRLPRSLERFALNFNLHDVHHRHPGLRWYELRDRFDAEGARYHAGWFRAAGRQFRGPIPIQEECGMDVMRSKASASERAASTASNPTPI